MNQKPNKLLAGYIPVIHQGYLDIIEAHRSDQIGVFDHTITSRFEYLRKDIRSLETDAVVNILSNLGYAALSLSLDEFHQQAGEPQQITLFDDDISRDLHNELVNPLASFTFESPFLRWDRRNTATNTTVQPDRIISHNDEIVKMLFQEANKSSDWWRHVAAGIIDGESIITTHNRAMPHEYVNFIDGDPRITESRGSNIEKSVFIHAEADLIAHMAQEGIQTKGKEIFVTTFPCPNCAKLIAASGIKTCYFIEGYATLDGQRVLQDAGVEIVKIDTKATHATDDSRWRTYPEKTND